MKPVRHARTKTHKKISSVTQDCHKQTLSQSPFQVKYAQSYLSPGAPPTSVTLPHFPVEHGFMFIAQRGHSPRCSSASTPREGGQGLLRTRKGDAGVPAQEAPLPTHPLRSRPQEGLFTSLSSVPRGKQQLKLSHCACQAMHLYYGALTKGHPPRPETGLWETGWDVAAPLSSVLPGAHL